MPPGEADYYAEGARRGGTLVCVCAESDDEAERAADILAEHGALDGRGRMYRDPRTRPSPSVRTPGASRDEPFRGPERRMRDQPYVGINRRVV